ncbi:hypothetical protein JCM8097_003512 [Rhodosporidiobolus ruineniae]
MSDAAAATPTEAARPAKPQRVKQACVRCFEAKVRCSGDQPACVRCLQKHAECYFNPAGNSRVKRLRTPADEGEFASTSGPTREDRGASASTSTTATAPATATESASDAPPVVVRQPFFRWLGLTSVMPPLQGVTFRPLTIAVQERDDAPSTAPPAPRPGPSDPVVKAAEAEAWVRVFYALFENYLPYMPLQEALEQIARGTFSEIVLVSMCALVKRVRPETPGPEAEQLADRAKALAITHLALPTLDTVYALLLLAYHEHGADRDAGLWAYCGMAIRACVDLGLHKPFEPVNETEAALRLRVAWDVICLDRILSCGTGRATTLPLSQIEIPLPPPRTTVRTSQGVDLPDPFPTLCSLFLITGNVSDAVNSTASSSCVPPEVPVSVQLELAEYQVNLLPSLNFSTSSFSLYASAGYGQVFLLLSVWHQAIHLAIHEAELLFTQPGTTMTAQGLPPPSGSSAVSVADMLAYSSVISDEAFLCTPILSQPILMAGRAASVLLRTLSTSAPTAQLEPLERAVTVCQKTLERMRERWHGLSWHVESMVKNARDVDLSGIGATILTSDRGMFAKAKLDDLARSCSWLLDELNTTPAVDGAVGVGFSSWGVSSGPEAPAAPPQSSVAVIRSGRTSPLLWTDQSGGLNEFAETMGGFLSADWATWQPSHDEFEDLVALPPSAGEVAPP